MKGKERDERKKKKHLTGLISLRRSWCGKVTRPGRNSIITKTILNDFLYQILKLLKLMVTGLCLKDGFYTSDWSTEMI